MFGRWEKNEARRANKVALLLSMNAAIMSRAHQKTPARWISLGLALSTICWIAATLGFGAYISTVRYSAVSAG